jgi:hypothetical protein
MSVVLRVTNFGTFYINIFQVHANYAINVENGEKLVFNNIK